MSETLVSHIGHVVKYLKEYWHIIAGVAAATYAWVRLVKHRWLSVYATKEELTQCHDKLNNEIARNREINTHEHNKIRDLIIELHKK